LSKEKHDESFRVVDRRLFGEDGQLRPDVAEQEEKDRAAAVQKLQAAASVSPPPALSATQAGAQAPGTAAPATPSTADAPKSSRHFRMLLGLLANQAEACLGGMADPRTGQAFLDLDGARAIVDIFDDLTERTRGNLAAEDRQILLDIIGNLKVTYLEMEKAAAAMQAADAAGAAPPGARAKR